MAKTPKFQENLFNNLGESRQWVASPPPVLGPGNKRIWLDLESTGKRKFKDKPVGIAYRLQDGRKGYLPMRHSGGNLPIEQVHEWARTELRGVEIRNINTGTDAEWMRNDGIDLEAQGCRLHDVAFSAALINEKRRKGFNLQDLGMEFVSRGKRNDGLDKSKMAEYHASMVGPYATDDADLVHDVDEAQAPMIEAEGLGRVLDLEDRLIWANNHIERNGARMDVPKLEGWHREIQDAQSELLMKVWEETGYKLAVNSGESWHKLFGKLGLPQRPVINNATFKEVISAYGTKLVQVDHNTYNGYTGEYLLSVDHPLVQAGLRARRFSSLFTKYIHKYLKHIGTTDRLGFNLYQLRSTEDSYGTVVGRYSSSNVNIQQVFKVENQVKKFGPEYIIRELMIPDEGYDLFASDGSQLQFRLFAHYSAYVDKTEALVRAYNENPDIDFHTMVANLIAMDRQAAKHNNFGVLLGMGPEKFCIRVGHACTCRGGVPWGRSDNFWDHGNHLDGCPAHIGLNMSEEYAKKFPAAKRLMKKVMGKAERDKVIRTLLGRCTHYEPGDAMHKAMAALLQGSEADVVKMKLLTLYDNRQEIGIHKLRMPVHDELTGDIERDFLARERLRRFCRVQEIKCKVPILWDTKFGRNWRDMDLYEDEKPKKGKTPSIVIPDFDYDLVEEDYPGNGLGDGILDKIRVPRASRN